MSTLSAVRESIDDPETVQLKRSNKSRSIISEVYNETMKCKKSSTLSCINIQKTGSSEY